MLFDAKSQLLRALETLATYNDKGIAWSRHAPEQVDVERAKMLLKIQGLVATMGESSFPTKFVQGLRSGALAVDGTGQFREALKRHFNG